MCDEHVSSAAMVGGDPRPLAGVTVVDLTRVLAGPYCTLILANLGARVIKVERPPLGDDARLIGPFVGGKSLYFAALNYGKESIALELRRDEDRAIFESLLGAADVLVENFRPGVLERLGWSRCRTRHRETLRRRQPDQAGRRARPIGSPCSAGARRGPRGDPGVAPRALRRRPEPLTRDSCLCARRSLGKGEEM